MLFQKAPGHVQGSLWSDTSPFRQAGITTLFWRLQELDSKVVGGSGQLDLMPAWEMFNSLTQTWKGWGSFALTDFQGSIVVNIKLKAAFFS